MCIAGMCQLMTLYQSHSWVFGYWASGQDFITIKVKAQSLVGYCLVQCIYLPCVLFAETTSSLTPISNITIYNQTEDTTTGGVSQGLIQ